LVALAPAFVLGGLFVLPALAAYSLWWCLRRLAPDRRRRYLAALAAASGISTSVLVVTWVLLYRPIGSKPGISSFWVAQKASLGASLDLFDLLHKAFFQTRDGLVGERALGAGGSWLMLATLLLAIGTLVGTAAIGHRWPMLLVTVVSAQVIAIAASATTHWPLTVERVNIAFQVLGFAVPYFGVATSIVWLTSHLRLGRLAAAPALAVLVSGLWFRPLDVGIHAFARGLTTDLMPIEASPAPYNLVVQYHSLAHFYTHDALINTEHAGHRFSIVSEQPGDTSLYQPIDAVVAQAHLRPGDMLWCVIPRAVGPIAKQACRFAPGDLHQIVALHGEDALVLGFVAR
jgi:hypothetical protein